MGSSQTVYTGRSEEELNELRKQYKDIIDKIEEKVKKLEQNNIKLMKDKNKLIDKVNECEGKIKDQELDNNNIKYINKTMKEEYEKSKQLINEYQEESIKNTQTVANTLKQLKDSEEKVKNMKKNMKKK